MYTENWCTAQDDRERCFEVIVRTVGEPSDTIATKSPLVLGRADTNVQNGLLALFGVFRLYFR